MCAQDEQPLTTLCRGTGWRRRAGHVLLEKGMQAALFERGETCLMHQELSGGRSAM